MSDFLRATAFVYLLLGILLGTLGPGGQDIAQEVKRVRGTPLSNAAMERVPPSELKLLWFRIAITLAFVLLWPVFTYGILKDRREAAVARKAVAERTQGLWFRYNMGGCGIITCNDCRHSEEVTSFIHGIDSSVTGFQCQTCGKLHSVNSGGRGRANQYERSLTCDCGGPLDRDELLFCPNCRSKNLSYFMQYIT